MEARVQRAARSLRRLPRSPRAAGRCGSARTSATASTRTICTASTTATGSSVARIGAAETSRTTRRMRLTIVHPCIGRRRRATPYIRTWQMEPLPAGHARRAHAARTSRSASTTIAWRRSRSTSRPTSWRSASRRTRPSAPTRSPREYRRRGVPVVMGGFHADAAARTRSRDYAEAVVVGEAEERLAATVIDDCAARPPAEVLPPGAAPAARGPAAGPLDLPRQALPARSASSKRDAAATSSATSARCRPSSAHTQTRRPTDEILDEIAAHEARQAAVLLRRRQHHVEPGAGEGVLPRADPAARSAG